ncbi:unnamed protein product, partial [Ectocarpus fasciculatus]
AAAGYKAQKLPSCEVYSENQCVGDQIETAESFEDHKWFTPERGSPGYLDSFQDYAKLVGHVHLTYDEDRTTATAEIVAEHRDAAALSFVFDGASQNSTKKTFTKATASKPVSISIAGADGSEIELDPIDFVWNAPAVRPVEEAKGDYRDGQKGAIVEFFMWPHDDVAKECEVLASMGYMGAKLFPAQEQIMSQEPFDGDLNPWFFAYQPVSYRLQGRMGSRDQLRDAINTCRAAGVRMYADAVINHMTGGGNDANPSHRNPGADCAEWGIKNSSLVTSGGASGPSPMYTQSYVYTEGGYTGKPPSQEFPAAHYGPTDFHCERPLNSWNDPLQLNAGWLSGLVDLNTEKENVQDRIADYLTDLLSIGFSGFRVDAAKHIQPDDLVAIFTKVRNNMGGTMPDDWVTWLEVLVGGEGDMLLCDVDSGYNYGGYLEDALLAAGWSQTDVNKVKIWNSGYPKEPQVGYCSISATRNAIQNDDADQQTSGSTSRDMGDQGCVLVEGCTVEDHRSFEVKLFHSPNGADDNENDFPIRMVLSSYYWQGDSSGVPDGLSDCDTCTINCDSGCDSTTKWAAYNATSCGYDSTYTRPHRDLDIVNAMRGWMHLDSLTANDLNLSC